MSSHYHIARQGSTHVEVAVVPPFMTAAAARKMDEETLVSKKPTRRAIGDLTQDALAYLLGAYMKKKVGKQKLFHSAYKQKDAILLYDDNEEENLFQLKRL